VEYAGKLTEKARQLILIHGEEDAFTAFKAKLDGMHMPPIIYPDIWDMYDSTDNSLTSAGNPA